MKRPHFRCVECQRIVQGPLGFDKDSHPAVCDDCFGGADYAREVRAIRVRNRGATP